MFYIKLQIVIDCINYKEYCSIKVKKE